MEGAANTRAETERKNLTGCIEMAERRLQMFMTLEDSHVACSSTAVARAEQIILALPSISRPLV